MQSEVDHDKHEQKKSSVHNRMLAFTFSLGKYYVFNGVEMPKELTWENIQDKAWIVINKVRNNKQTMLLDSGKYKLSQGDIIRFGRVVFRVNFPQKAALSQVRKRAPAKGKQEVLDTRNKQALNKCESTKTLMPFDNLMAKRKPKSKFSKNKNLESRSD